MIFVEHFRCRLAFSLIVCGTIKLSFTRRPGNELVMCIKEVLGCFAILFLSKCSGRSGFFSFVRYNDKHSVGDSPIIVHRTLPEHGGIVYGHGICDPDICHGYRCAHLYGGLYEDCYVDLPAVAIDGRDAARNLICIYIESLKTYASTEGSVIVKLWGSWVFGKENALRLLL